MSTAYYAVFHCLARTAASELIGGTRDEAWHRVYRALDHAAAARACRDKEAMARFPGEVRRIAAVFLSLQKARINADYALDTRFYKSAVLGRIDSAELAVQRFGLAPAETRRAFAAHLLFRRRP